ncbi:MAG TPA: hypothetical protein VI321_11180 [Burkholderiales bacterium]
MHGVTTLTQPQLWMLLGSGSFIGLICAIKDLRWPGEMPGMVLGTALTVGLNAWYSVRWPANLFHHLDAVSYEMALRCAYLLVISFFLVGSVSVGVSLLWLLFRPEPS